MSPANEKKLTLKDIAVQLGVSTATISNAFNRPDQLSPRRREQILAKCKEIGYTGPSLTARSLRTGKTGVLGVLLANNLEYNFSDPVATEFLAGIAEALDQQHVNMLLLPSCTENYSNTQVDSIPDSFIIYGKPMDDGIVERLVQRNKPIVAVDFNLDGFPSIHVDNQQACYEIAKHALKSKSERVLILGFRLQDSRAISIADPDQLYSAHESISRLRLEGYKQALSEVGIKLKNKHIWQIHQLDDHALELVLRGALTDPSPPSVLLCMSDRIAISALKVARKLDIDVPGKLKIVGFDGIKQAKEHGLTTVEQPSAKKGHLAAQMALGIQPYQSVQLDTQIKQRASS